MSERNLKKSSTEVTPKQMSKEAEKSQKSYQPMPGLQQHIAQRPLTPPMPLPNIPNRRPIGCPPGLEYLLFVDQLIIKQKVEIFETLTRIETNNKYEIQNSLGQNVYFAAEGTDYFTRNICGPNRSFDISIYDQMSREVIHLSRPYRCDCCCCFCCLQFIRVESPPGNLIGHIRQEWSPVRPIYRIEDSSGKKLLRIRGPIVAFGLCGQDIEFTVLANNRDIRVGRITKQWSGIVREIYTNADIYGIGFPMDMNVTVKALILSSAFLIDYMFFERRQHRDDDDRRHRGREFGRYGMH